MSTFSIRAQFSECGEWGGHEEKIIVNTDDKMNLYAHYMVYPFNCDSLEYYLGKEHLKPIYERLTLLDKKKKKSLMEYLIRLTESKLTEQFPGHAGSSFSVTNSDSTFIIEVYDRKKYDANSYKRLIKELF